MKPAVNITPSQMRTLRGLIQYHLPGVVIWAYGSRVNGTAKTNSDLDLIVFAKAEQARSVSELREALDESSLPFLVDLHVWSEVPERFHRIIQESYVELK